MIGSDDEMEIMSEEEEFAVMSEDDADGQQEDILIDHSGVSPHVRNQAVERVRDWFRNHPKEEWPSSSSAFESTLDSVCHLRFSFSFVQMVVLLLKLDSIHFSMEDMQKVENLAKWTLLSKSDLKDDLELAKAAKECHAIEIDLSKVESNQTIEKLVQIDLPLSQNLIKLLRKLVGPTLTYPFSHCQQVFMKEKCNEATHYVPPEEVLADLLLSGELSMDDRTEKITYSSYFLQEAPQASWKSWIIYFALLTIVFSYFFSPH